MSSPAPFPFEFAIAGIPVSHQSRNKSALAAWRQLVRESAAAAWGSVGPVETPLRIAVTYFHEEPRIRLDLDNMLKPIQDALNGLVYRDDRQIVDVEIRKAMLDDPIRARHRSLVLLRGFHVGAAFVHVIIDVAPSHAEPLR